MTNVNFMSTEEPIRAFDEEMMNIYRRALSEVGYRATRFQQMLFNYKGLETARILLHSNTVSEGYTALWERGRLDLTVEATIINNEKYYMLFTEQELEICRKRLDDYHYQS